jgi:hypothetical protein
VKTGALLVALLQNENQPSDVARQMLQSTILPAEEQETVCRLLTQVLSHEKTLTLDASVVSDALILAGADFKVEPESVGLITAGAKMIYALQFSKKAIKSHL